MKESRAKLKIFKEEVMQKLKAPALTGAFFGKLIEVYVYHHVADTVSKGPF